MPVTRHPLMPQNPDDGDLPNIAIDEVATARLAGSLEVIRARGPAIASTFYRRLFERAPHLRGMFPQDMSAQERKLIDSLAMVVQFIREPAKVMSNLRQLGERHAKYGAKAEHYPIVCAMLVQAMGEESGPTWSSQLAQEWAQALELVSQTMMNSRPKQ